MEFDFQSETALVTGAGSGIGRATAGLLSAAGAAVVGLDIEPEPKDGRDQFEDVVDDGTLIVGDVSDAVVVNAAVEEATQWGGVDIAVNCAGVGSHGRLDAIDADDLRRAYEVHVEGTYNVCSAVVNGMVDRGTGRIVNTSSIAAQLGWPGTADYAPAKGAIQSMTRQLAADYSPDGIRINAVSPGFVKTGMNADVWAAEKDAKFDERVGIETARDRTLLPYLGEPDDVAGVIGFLVSDRSRFITGQIVTVDGGWTVGAW